MEFIKCMRQAGLPVDVLAEYVRLCRQGDAALPRRKQLLKEQRRALVQRIADMQETLRRLDGKIEHYDPFTVPGANTPQP